MVNAVFILQDGNPHKKGHRLPDHNLGTVRQWSIGNGVCQVVCDDGYNTPRWLSVGHRLEMLGEDQSAYWQTTDDGRRRPLVAIPGEDMDNLTVRDWRVR